MKSNVPAQYRGFDTYTKTDHHTYVKENFKELAKLISQKVDGDLLSPTSRVLDVGCATGALISYLGECFKGFTFTGIDISSELIDIAKDKLPKSEFIVGDISSLPNLRVPLYDIALCIGVIGIFDEKEARDALERLIASVRPGGVIYVFHQFNEIDVDVMVKHRRVGVDVTWDGWGAGWNIYSYRTVGQWLGGRVTSHRFVDFSMPFALSPQENPVRTWTVDMADGTRRLTNGLKLLVDLKFLEIVV